MCGVTLCQGVALLTESLAESMRDSDFLGIQLRDVQAEKPKLLARIKVHQLFAEQQLPAILSPPCEFRDGRGCRFTDGIDYSKGILLSDGNYYHPQLHFDGSKLDLTKVADLSRTTERFGLPSVTQPIIVFSKRMRNLLVAQKVEGNWAPVHLH